MLFKKSLDDVITQARIGFCSLALEGEPYARQTMLSFIADIGNNPTQHNLKEAAYIVADIERMRAIVRDYQESLSKQGIDVKGYTQTPEEKEKLNNLALIMLLNHGDPVADRKTSLRLNLKVSALSFLAGTIVVPFGNIVLGHPIEKFDRYWNPALANSDKKPELPAKSQTVTQNIAISRDKFGGVTSVQIPASVPVSEGLVKSILTDREKTVFSSQPSRRRTLGRRPLRKHAR